ncbi:MAG: DNA polymerase III subunit delta [Helicobacter sp.]|nr:DNA polymerase III subunit delta [Helicobacter sp.]
MQYQFGHILLVKEPLEEAVMYYEQNNPQFFRLFCTEDLTIEIARNIIDESYIASDGVKTILIAANTFNIPAQNALLKVLEEPPNQVKFILFAKTKSLLLPTIRSRMPVVNKIKTFPLPHFSLKIESLTLASIYEFLKQKQKEFYSSDTKLEIQALYMDCIKYGLKFTPNEHQMFEEALMWDYQKERSHFIFAVLLPMVLEVKNRH